MRANPWKSVLENHVVMVVLALTFVVPLLFSGPAASRLEQTAAFGLVGLVLLVVWVLRAQGPGSMPRVKAFLRAGPTTPVLLYLGWSVLTVMLGREPFYGQIAALQLAFGVLVFLVVSFEFEHKEQFRALLIALQVVALALVLGAFALDAERKLKDLSGPYHDRQLFGAFLAILLPVLVGIAAGAPERRWKIVGQAAALLVAAALVLTGCRSSWIGQGIAAVVFAGLTLRYVAHWRVLERRKHELIVTPLLALLILCGFVGFTGAGAGVRSRVATFGRLARDVSFQGRLQSWGTPLTMLRARPVQGHGLGGYALAQVEFNPSSRRREAILRSGPSLTENPHNLYLLLLAETGVVGLGLYLLVLGAWFRTAVLAIGRLRPGLRQQVLIGCVSAVAGQCVDSISNPGWVFPEVSLFFWLVLAIGMGAAGLREKLPAVETPANPATYGFGIPVPVLRAAAVGVAGLWATSSLFNLSLVNPAAAAVHGLQGGNAPVPRYEEPEGDGDGINAGVVAGGALLTATPFIAGAIGGGGAVPVLAPNVQRVGSLRLVPENVTLRPGECQQFRLQATEPGSDQWQDATGHPNAVIELEQPDPCLVRSSSRPNEFCVPPDAPASCDGRSVTVIGRLRLPDGTEHSTQARVLIRVPAREGATP